MEVLLSTLLHNNEKTKNIFNQMFTEGNTDKR